MFSFLAAVGGGCLESLNFSGCKWYYSSCFTPELLAGILCITNTLLARRYRLCEWKMSPCFFLPMMNWFPCFLQRWSLSLPLFWQSLWTHDCKCICVSIHLPLVNMLLCPDLVSKSPLGLFPEFFRCDFLLSCWTRHSRLILVFSGVEISSFSGDTWEKLFLSIKSEYQASFWCCWWFFFSRLFSPNRQC